MIVAAVGHGRIDSRTQLCPELLFLIAYIQTSALADLPVEYLV